MIDERTTLEIIQQEQGLMNNLNNTQEKRDTLERFRKVVWIRKEEKKYCIHCGGSH